MEKASLPAKQIEQMAVAFERCSFAMRLAVGSFNDALNNPAVKKCLMIMAREENDKNELISNDSD